MRPLISILLAIAVGRIGLALPHPEPEGDHQEIPKDGPHEIAELWDTPAARFTGRTPAGAADGPAMLIQPQLKPHDTGQAGPEGSDLTHDDYLWYGMYGDYGDYSFPDPTATVTFPFPSSTTTSVAASSSTTKLSMPFSLLTPTATITFGGTLLTSGTSSPPPAMAATATVTVTITVPA